MIINVFELLSIYNHGPYGDVFDLLSSVHFCQEYQLSCPEHWLFENRLQIISSDNLELKYSKGKQVNQNQY